MGSFGGKQASRGVESACQAPGFWVKGFGVWGLGFRGIWDESR